MDLREQEMELLQHGYNLDRRNGAKKNTYRSEHNLIGASYNEDEPTYRKLCVDTCHPLGLLPLTLVEFISILKYALTGLTTLLLQDYIRSIIDVTSGHEVGAAIGITFGSLLVVLVVGSFVTKFTKKYEYDQRRKWNVSNFKFDE